jgi:hypothetical protein
MGRTKYAGPDSGSGHAATEPDMASHTASGKMDPAIRVIAPSRQDSAAIATTIEAQSSTHPLARHATVLGDGLSSPPGGSLAVAAPPVSKDTAKARPSFDRKGNFCHGARGGRLRLQYHLVGAHGQCCRKPARVRLRGAVDSTSGARAMAPPAGARLRLLATLVPRREYPRDRTRKRNSVGAEGPS